MNIGVSPAAPCGPEVRGPRCGFLVVVPRQLGIGVTVFGGVLVCLGRPWVNIVVSPAAPCGPEVRGPGEESVIL